MNPSAALSQTVNAAGGGNPTPSIQTIPTLFDWALVLLSTMLAGWGLYRRRRR